MGLITLRPTAGTHPTPNEGNWPKQPASSGSSHAQILSDDSDSYIETADGTTSTSRGRAYFNLAPSGGDTLPGGARVRTMRTFVRARKYVDGHRTVTCDLDLSLKNAVRPGDCVVTKGEGAWYHIFQQHTLERTAKTFYGKPATAWYDGTEVTQSKLNRLLAGFANVNRGSGNKTHVRIYELGVEVEYDERPNVTAGTSGTIASTSSPVLAWGYEDDFETQEAYQVEVYDDLGALVYDTGTVQDDANFHEVADSLAPGDYTWRVRASQRWPDRPGGRFWSVWSAQLSFTIETITPASPSLLATAGGHRVELDVLTNLNLADDTLAHFENGVEPVVSDATGLSNCTVDEGATAHSGGKSLRINFTAASPSGDLSRRHVLVTAGLEYTFAFWTLNEPGDPALDARVRVAWFNENMSEISASAGSFVTQSDGIWTRHEVNATAPASAVDAEVQFNITGGASGDIYYLDDVEVYRDDSAAGFPAGSTHDDVNRGGLFPPPSGHNALTYEDTTMQTGHSWMPSDSTDGDNTEVELTTDQAFHGDTSLLLRRINSTGGIDASLLETRFVEVPDDATQARWSAYFRAATTGRTVRVWLEERDADGVAISSVNAFTTDTASGWERAGSQKTLEAATRYINLGLTVDGPVATEEHYADQVQLSFVEPVPLLLRTADGERDFEGPTTEVQYSEDSGTTWIAFTELSPTETSGVIELFDHEIALDVPRIYRARNYGTVNGERFVSPWSNATASVSADFTGIWMNKREALGSEPSLEYNFEFDGGGRSEDINDGGAEIAVAGRKYPLAEWGEEQARAIAASVALPSKADLDAFKELVRARALLVYRDGRYNRAVGRIEAPTISYEPGAAGWSATFTFKWQGEQIGSED